MIVTDEGSGPNLGPFAFVALRCPACAALSIEFSGAGVAPHASSGSLDVASKSLMLPPLSVTRSGYLPLRQPTTVQVLTCKSDGEQACCALEFA